MERETTFARSSHNDYVASEFLKSCGFGQLKFTTREVNCDGAKVALLHAEGVRSGDGLVLDMDFWPNRNQTIADIEALGSVLQDAIIRFGYYEETDTVTGEIRTVSGKPKFAKYFADGQWHSFSGARKRFEDTWTNEVPAEPEAEEAEDSNEVQGERAVA